MARRSGDARSLLSILLVVSGALASRVEAGPRAFGPAAQPAFLLLDKARAPREFLSSDQRPSPSWHDLAQRAVTPEAERERRPDARLPGKDGRKKPAVAGLLSAAVPGAGQFYNGSRMGYLFLGVEAAAWIAHFSLHDTGTAKQEQFRKFADAHWSWDRYRDPAFEDCPPNGHSDSGVQDSTLWSLYTNRRNDFYEDIGKLFIYSCGWDSQTNRDVYRDMRDDANKFLSNARTATTIVFLNHVVSALHAARGAARHNARLSGDMEIDLNLSIVAYDPAARLTLTRYF